MWLSAPNLHVVHGFSTRKPERSIQKNPWQGNLSGRVGDDPQRVERNQNEALGLLGFPRAKVMLCKQIHSAKVLPVRLASLEDSGSVEADAMVTNTQGMALAIETADCYPILFEDHEAGVVGAAHAGWRGTVAGIAKSTLEAMVALGARLASVQVAIGPGICSRHFGIGQEVQRQFLEAGFPANLTTENESGLHLDLRAANRWLIEQHLSPDQVWESPHCSHETQFFSYRRDAGQTGRMWAVIANQATRLDAP